MSVFGKQGCHTSYEQSAGRYTFGGKLQGTDMLCDFFIEQSFFCFNQFITNLVYFPGGKLRICNTESSKIFTNVNWLKGNGFFTGYGTTDSAPTFCMERRTSVPSARDLDTIEIVTIYQNCPDDW